MQNRTDSNRQKKSSTKKSTKNKSSTLTKEPMIRKVHSSSNNSSLISPRFAKTESLSPRYGNSGNVSLSDSAMGTQMFEGQQYA